VSTLEETRETAKKARDLAEKAEGALRTAEIEAAARDAEGALREATRAVWEVCNLGEWTDPLVRANEAAEDARDALAVACLGAKERLAKLTELDPDRWTPYHKTENPYGARPSGFTKDSDVAYDVATWLFDSGFGRAEGINEWWGDPERERFEKVTTRIAKVLGEVGVAGIKAWREGRHDT